MPLYDYERPDGTRVELFRTVAERDNVPAGLRRVVSRPAGRGLFTGHAMDPTDADSAVPRAFKQLEEQMPRREIERQCGFSTAVLRRTWDFDKARCT